MNDMKKDLVFSPAQKQELLDMATHDKRSHVRLKARAVHDVGEGMSRVAVARALGVERRSVANWVRRYLSEGPSAFAIRKGRGPKGKAVAEELKEYVRRAPRQFGVERTRWNLAMLKDTVPSLKGMSESGVWRALKRLGLRYKRGQPVVHSPDPEYGEKRGPSFRH